MSIKRQFSKFSRLIDFASADQLPFDFYLKAKFADGVEVGTVEGIERRSWSFSSAVASHQMVIKQEQNLRDIVVSGYGECTKQVINCVIANLPYGDWVESKVPCEPVRMIVFFKLSIMKERMLAVKLMVSVPWRMMKASNSRWIFDYFRSVVKSFPKWYLSARCSCWWNRWVYQVRRICTISSSWK